MKTREDYNSARYHGVADTDGVSEGDDPERGPVEGPAPERFEVVDETEGHYQVLRSLDVPDRIRLERLWEPHSGQKDIWLSEARFRIAACGRRFGKTVLAAHDLVENAAGTPDGLSFWVAPTYPIADTGFKILKEIIPDALLDGQPKRSKPKHFDLINGHRIEIRSADRKDGLVSVGLDYVVIDEAAMVPERTWAKELRATLSDTLGKMFAISTPKGENWFKDYFQRGQSDGERFSHIESWAQPTSANPYILETEIEDARYDLPERIFEQEYLATFLEDSGGVFKKVRDRIVGDYGWMNIASDSGPNRTLAGVPAGNHDPTGDGFVHGVDFARHEDWTVIQTLSRATGKLVRFERIRYDTWGEIQRAIEDAVSMFPGPAFLDATRDNKIIPDLEDAGVETIPVHFSPKKKRDLIENLITAIENEEIQIPDIPTLISELQAFERTTTKAGNVRYHAPEAKGFHDDCVDSLALAVEGLELRGRAPSGTATFGPSTSDRNAAESANPANAGPVGGRGTGVVGGRGAGRGGGRGGSRGAGGITILSPDEAARQRKQKDANEKHGYTE